MERIYEVEKKTTARVQDEPWYDDYNVVCEIMCAGPVGGGTISFYEELPNGLELAFKRCKEDFESSPGPPGWTPPSDERIMSWIKCGWFTPEDMAKIRSLQE
jgi:hypothetical protein